MIIVFDSDGLIGSLNPNDVHYLTSKETLSKLINKNTKFIYPATTIVETITFLQGRINKPELARKIIELLLNNDLDIEPINNKLLQDASYHMNFQGSKHHTLFDAIVLTIAKKYNADAIFSFDSFYPKNGFKLVSDILKIR